MLVIVCAKPEGGNIAWSTKLLLPCPWCPYPLDEWLLLDKVKEEPELGALLSSEVELEKGGEAAGLGGCTGTVKRWERFYRSTNARQRDVSMLLLPCSAIAVFDAS